MKLYVATYGMHMNGSISNIEERVIEANSLEEAQSKAKALGEALELVYGCPSVEPEDYSPAEWWADLESLQEA